MHDGQPSLAYRQILLSRSFASQMQTLKVKKEEEDSQPTPFKFLSSLAVQLTGCARWAA
jgi:hypothetical protein